MFKNLLTYVFNSYILNLKLREISGNLNGENDMSLSLPTTNSELRSMFSINDLIDMNNMPTFRQALNSAADFMAAEPAAKSVNSLCMRANGHIWLITIGPKGGWKRRWNFSK